jgi:hypothetical protein
MPSSHGQQKQREKQKKKREAAKRKLPSRSGLLDTSPANLMRQAALLPWGPCFISRDWRDGDPTLPTLVTVIVTRQAPGSIVVPAIALVDRTCLGVKNGFVAKPMLEKDLAPFLAQVGHAHQVGMEPCDPLLAQSVVFHAVDYARSLGFEPHADFPAPIFGPRPEALLDTPLARPERPVYYAGPDDPVDRIVAQLDARVGRGGFDLGMPAGAPPA